MAEQKQSQTPKTRPQNQNKPAKPETPAKDVRVKRLYKGKTPQKKREQSALKVQRQEKALQKKEETYSNERYVSAEEALGPTVYNEHYLKKASIYRYIRYGILILLVVFLLGMLNLFREEITVENFRYLMRNVDFELRTEMGEAGSISYDSNPLNTFTVYKGSLAQLSDRQIAIYDASGRSSYTGSLDYTAPGLISSDKYLLAYDRVGGSYSLYTGFSQVHASTTGYPITDADISDEGIYVIASRSKDYFGVVEVYSNSFQLMNKVQKNKYIASVDLAEDGKTLLIASYYVGTSGVCTELMVLSIDSDTPKLLMSVEGTMPWEATWLDEEHFVLVCDKGVKFYDQNGKNYNEYGFSAKNVIEYTVDSEAGRVAILSREGSDTTSTRLQVLDAKGKSVLEQSITGNAGQLTFFGDRLLLAVDRCVYSLSKDGKCQQYESDRPISAIVAKGDTLYLCAATRVLIPEWTATQN